MSSGQPRPRPRPGTALPEHFETRTARAVAASLDLTVCFVQAVLAWVTTGFAGVVAVFVWHGVLWLLAHAILLRVKGGQTIWKVLTVACVILLLGIPRSDLYQGVAASAAAAGASGVFNGSRALQVMLSPGQFKGWGPWQHFYHLCCWGWHDVETCRPIHPRDKVPVLRRLAVQGSTSLAVMMVTAILLYYMPDVPLNSARDLLQARSPPILVLLLLRWLCAAIAVVGFFALMDTIPPVLYCFFCNVTVDSIFGGFPRGRGKEWSLAYFWGSFWNRPVNRLLRALYGPFRQVIGSTMAKFCVFLVSGLGHTYALNCCRSPPWMQTSVLTFFLIQLPVLQIENLLGLKGRLWVFAALFVPLPIFLEPLLATIQEQ